MRLVKTLQSLIKFFLGFILSMGTTSLWTDADTAYSWFIRIENILFNINKVFHLKYFKFYIMFDV